MSMYEELISFLNGSSELSSSTMFGIALILIMLLVIFIQLILIDRFSGE